jgi:TolB-like protein/class 3 adenylate cyclase
MTPRKAGVMPVNSASEDLQCHDKVVLVVDLVGSVRLMQLDELGVIRHWQSFQSFVVDSALPENHGRLVKSLGDGLMVEFDTAPSAAACALAMHRWFETHPQDVDVVPMQLRIGLHGTHVYEGEHDIYGTGVNLAARIAALAQPGQTVISTAVRDGLTDGLDGILEDLGDWFLKHVDHPVHVYGLRPAGQVRRPPRTHITEPPSLRPVLAVIPFVSRSMEPELYALGDLIVEGVIGQLSRTPELKVISHLSTQALRGRSASVEAAKSHLGAQFVLTGSYVARGNKLTVICQLVDAHRNEVLWADRVSGEVEDLVEPRSEICDAIANGCHRALLDKEAQSALVRPIPNLQSSTLLVGGIGLMHRSAPAQFMRTREILEALVERHGQSALPRVWLAKWYVLCSTRGLGGKADTGAQAALQETRRALDAEPGNSLAWAMQGFVYCHLSKDVDHALQSCTRAIEWNTNESLAWLFKAMVHAFDGNGKEALPAGERALSLSPLDPLKYYYNSLMASIAISAERYDMAIDLAEQSLRANAAHLSSYRALVIAQSLAGRTDAARRSLALLEQHDPLFTIDRFAQGYPARDRVPQYLDHLKAALRAAGAKEH